MAYNYRLDRAVRELGITFGDLGKLVGDDKSVVSRILHGKYKVDELRKIRYAKALKMKPEELFD